MRGTRWDPPTPTAAHPAPPPPRCIKPNDTKTAMLFTPDLVLAQVRYLGLMENVRVRRAGYAFRQLYQPFLERYKMLSRKTWPRWTGGDRSGGEGGGGWVAAHLAAPLLWGAGSEQPRVLQGGR